MQSIASLMSIGRANDIGNLEDMDEDAEREERGSDDDNDLQRRHTEAQITSLASQLGQLAEQNYDEQNGDDNGNLFSTVGKLIFLPIAVA